MIQLDERRNCRTRPLQQTLKLISYTILFPNVVPGCMLAVRKSVETVLVRLRVLVTIPISSLFWQY